MTKSKEKKGQVVVPASERSLSPFEEMDRLFNQLWEGGMLRPFGSRWPLWGEFAPLTEHLPKVDIIERDKEIVVKAELPGISKENLTITLNDDYLTLQAEVKEETAKEGEVRHSEIRRRSFTRSVRLPAAVDGSKTKAEFKDGMLEIVLPKAEVRAPHHIEIS